MIDQPTTWDIEGTVSSKGHTRETTITCRAELAAMWETAQERYERMSWWDRLRRRPLADTYIPASPDRSSLAVIKFSD